MPKGTVGLLAFLFLIMLSNIVPARATVGLFQLSNFSWCGDPHVVSCGQVTVIFLVNSNTSNPGVDANSFVQRVIDAANTWKAVSGILFQYGGATTRSCGVDNGAGVDVIGWSTLAGTPPPLAGTTPFTFSGNELSQVTTCFNNDSSISWSVSPTGPLNSGVYDLQSDALHEFGHWVDLLDLSINNCNLAECSSQVMWFQLASATFKRVL